MMKNRIIALLGVLALFVLVGCGGDGKNGAASDYTLLEETAPPTPPTPPGPPTPTPPTPIPPVPIDPTDNVAPVADAGSDQHGSTAGSVTLNGSNSYDPDNAPSPLTYKWTLVDIPSGSAAILVGDTSITPIFTTDKDGSYHIELVVYDGDLHSAVSSVFVTVNSPLPVNKPPVAVIEGSVGTTVVELHKKTDILLDGTKSTDDGLKAPLTFSWASGHFIVPGPTIYAQASCDYTGWEHCYKSICYHNITLTVNDGQYSDTAETQVAVDYSICNVGTIHLDPAYTQSIPVTKHKTYTLWAYQKVGNPIDVTSKAILTTSDASIATIDASGIATGHKKGTVQIIAQYAGQTDHATLIITD